MCADLVEYSESAAGGLANQSRLYGHYFHFLFYSLLLLVTITVTLPVAAYHRSLDADLNLKSARLNQLQANARG